MDYIDLLIMLDLRVRAAPSGRGYGYEVIRQCPMCSNGFLAVYQLVEVSDEVFKILQEIEFPEERLEVFNKNCSGKYSHLSGIWVPMADVKLPNEGCDNYGIVLPFSAWNRYTERITRVISRD